MAIMNTKHTGHLDLRQMMWLVGLLCVAFCGLFYGLSFSNKWEGVSITFYSISIVCLVLFWIWLLDAVTTWFDGNFEKSLCVISVCIVGLIVGQSLGKEFWSRFGFEVGRLTELALMREFTGTLLVLTQCGVLYACYRRHKRGSQGNARINSVISKSGIAILVAHTSALLLPFLVIIQNS